MAKNLNLGLESIKVDLIVEGGKQETLMDFYYAVNIGIMTVPLFIFDHKTILYITQPRKNILEAMKKVEALPNPVEETTEVKESNLI
ncbi:MAG: hypothetical protein HeimC2_41930 [Candidatus Heimdallarchaeota archaeon LC_2]|nr:MAG: hypothetical protein HeimC2_41930 [Candidatus Heimdallarchaeota archaeon LC_2]